MRNLDCTQYIILNGKTYHVWSFPFMAMRIEGRGIHDSDEGIGDNLELNK